LQRSHIQANKNGYTNVKKGEEEEEEEKEEDEEKGRILAMKAAVSTTHGKEKSRPAG
jgi:hypothetical protein